MTLPSLGAMTLGHAHAWAKYRLRRNEVPISFGEWLRVQRKSLGFSQPTLANAAKVDQATISRLETGRQSEDALSLGAVKRLLVALDVSFDTFCIH